MLIFETGLIDDLLVNKDYKILVINLGGGGGIANALNLLRQHFKRFFICGLSRYGFLMLDSCHDKARNCDARRQNRAQPTSDKKKNIKIQMWKQMTNKEGFCSSIFFLSHAFKPLGIVQAVTTKY
jgi:hypothetical protein